MQSVIKDEWAEHILRSFPLPGYKVLSLLEVQSNEADAMDQADLYIHTTNIKKWDICAGDALLTSLGNNTAAVFQHCCDLPGPQHLGLTRRLVSVTVIQECQTHFNSQDT